MDIADFFASDGGQIKSKRKCKSPNGGPIKLPRHIEPNDVVNEVAKCVLKTCVQHELLDSEFVHHDPTTPATVTCTMF
jgi:hypothetical protein